MRPVICALLVLAFAAPCHAQDGALLRFVEFRDGSVMRLPIVDEAWQITVINSSGQVQQTMAQLAQMDNLIFTREKGFAKKQALLAAVRRLGADDFHDREQAQAELVGLGAAVRGDLENCLGFSSDAEARLRLQGILKSLPPTGAQRTATAVFDRFRLGDDCWGHLGDSGLPVRVDGKVVRLSREDVTKVSRAGPPYMWVGDARPFERCAAAEFPSGCLNEPFERTPSGRPLQVGENIERLFIDRGFMLSTSMTNSYVSVNNFKVDGKSGGLSVATHQPLWEGAITVRFVEPGNEQAPAGVNYFGCWIAAVVPNGTFLIAFDRHGRELGRIGTQAHGNDFLGVRSAAPMYSIQIAPNPSFDRDYTLDDFIFSPPHNPENRHPQKFIVHLRNGGRFLCGDVSFEADGVHASGMPAALPDWTSPIADVERIAFPGDANAPPPSGVFAELQDGSVIVGKVEGKSQPKFARVPDVLDGKQLRALWNSRLPGAKLPANDKTYAWNSGLNRWHEISGLRFLEEVVIWKKDGAFESSAYDRLPPIRLTAEPQVAAGSWRVITENGDDLVQTGQQPRGRLSQGLAINWQSRPLQLMRSEMRFLVQVQR